MCVGVPRPVRKRHLLLSQRGHATAVLPAEGKEATVIVVDSVDMRAKSVTPEPQEVPSLPERTHKKTVRFSSDPSSVAVVVDTVPSRSDIMAAGAASSVWYSPRELDQVRERARETARRLAIRKMTAANKRTTSSSFTDGESSSTSSPPASSKPQTPAPTSEEEDEDLSCARGFELRLCPLRQRRRALAHGATLEYARRQQQKKKNQCDASTSADLIDPSVRLALVSSKLSRWAREVALSSGHSDFLDAYDVFRAVLPPPRTIEEISREHAFPIDVTSQGAAAGTKAKATAVIVATKRRSSSSREDQEERRVKRRIC
uniref:Uncharacterized protein n=1 Tax=Pseudictyota dubia TaxID=2749911 RepID=A0A7R9VHM9_9STRA|mmetsp:Transcript_14706/g.28143  ORF Transcript_14706/g.28143 Transcript_14706/m.28143 type:complete len:317 (+) Transcript_14706:179-1129(+)